MTSKPSIQIDLADEAATAILAARLAAHCRPGDVLALKGDLGAGKSSLARAFVRSLCGDEEEVPSPTFTLVQLYYYDSGTIWHFDLYRLEKPEDALELGIEEAFADGVSLIEWSERLGPWLPHERLEVLLTAPPEGGCRRRAELSAKGKGWMERLGAMFAGEKLSD